MKNILLLILITVFSWFPVTEAGSQELFTVKGYIFNTETDEPVTNANIVVSETKTGTSSDNSGHFELKLAGGRYNLTITSVGFSERRLAIKIPAENMESVRVGLLPAKLEIEGVDVYGNYYIPDRDTSINRIPASIMPATSTISAVEIEKQGAVTLIDAVKYVPGGWTESRGRKTKQFFSVRGQKYPYPNYSIDGIWQKEFEETGYFFSALDIEYVEIVRSSTALVKGLSGLTGVVDVKTKKPQKETASLMTKYGEYNSYVTNLQYGNKINDLSFNTSASTFGTDGPDGRKGKERIMNFHGNMDWQIADKFQLYAGAGYIHGLREFVSIAEPGAANIANREEKYDPVRALITYLKLNYAGNNGSLTELQTNLTHRNADYVNYNIPQDKTSYEQEKDWEYGFNLLHSQPLSPSNTLRIGGLYNHWQAPNGKRYYVGRSCNVHTWSGVIADEQRIGRFLLDGGFRIIGGHIVEWSGFGIEGSASGFQNVAPIEDEAAQVEWQSALGASYIFNSSLSLHYNFSGGTIAPRKGSLNEDGVTPKTEGRFQHDLGLRYKCPRNNEFSVSAFHTNRKNAIDFSGKTVTTEDDLVLELYENLNKQSYGVEFSAKINIPVISSSFFTNAMVMTGKKENNGTKEKDEQIPGFVFNTGIMYDNSGFDANLFVNYTGPYKNNRFVNPAWVAENGDFPLGDFASVDLTAGYTFTGKFSARIFAEGKNLFNKKYLTVAGYPDIGRLVQLGLKVSY